jgi:dephospho-CoA kinase
MKIIGLSGTNGSGKDTVAKFLVSKYGYVWGDATTMLGDELTRRGVSHTRANKAQLSAEWRRESGMGVIVDKAVELCKATPGAKGLVVSSLRHPGEAERIHELGGTVVWVDSDPRVRYERIQNNAHHRGRAEEDNKTFEEFLAEEQAEMQHSGDEATLNMGGVKALADVTIENDGNDLNILEDKIIQALGLTKE